MADDITFHSHSSAAPAHISDDHALRGMFRKLVAHAIHDTLGLTELELSRYLADMLTDFTHSDNIYRVKNHQGLRLKQVADMLTEADVSLAADSFDRERRVHKHIGDFALFWAGLYPESLQSRNARNSPDNLIDYVRQGKQSYYIVSTFNHGVYAREAQLFRKLSEEFELCRYGLSLVRREWEHSAKQAGH